MEPGRKNKLRILSGHDVPDEHRGRAALMMLIRVFDRLTANGGELAKRHGLTLSHLEVLLCLHREEGLSQQDLAERLLLTKGNICVIVQKLEAAGLIERKTDPEDQRFLRIGLAEAGRAKLREIMPVHVGLHRRALKYLSLAEQKTLHELLCRMDDALGEED